MSTHDDARPAAAPPSASAPVHATEPACAGGDDADVAGALRLAHVDERAPSFASTVAVAHARRRRALVPALAVALAGAAGASAAAVVAVSLSLTEPRATTPAPSVGPAARSSSSSSSAAAAAAGAGDAWLTSSSLTLPTDFLLDLPGRERLRSRPRFTVPIVDDAAHDADARDDDAHDDAHDDARDDDAHHDAAHDDDATYAHDTDGDTR